MPQDSNSGTTPIWNGSMWIDPQTGQPWPVQLPPPGDQIVTQSDQITPPPDPTTGTGGPGPTLPPGSVGSLLTPFGGTAPTYQQPTYPNAPTFPDLPEFNAPTEEEAANTPGYKFGFDQGQKLLDQSAAARGVTNTGGTLKDIVDYGRNAATQNYQTTLKNSEDIYATNLYAKYLAPYNAAFQQWQTQVPYAAQNNSNQNTFNWNNYLQNYRAFDDQRKFTYNSLYGLGSLGATVQ